MVLSHGAYERCRSEKKEARKKGARQRNQAASSRELGKGMVPLSVEGRAPRKGSHASACARRFATLLNCFTELHEESIPLAFSNAVHTRNDAQLQILFKFLSLYLSRKDDGKTIREGFEVLMDAFPLLADEFEVVTAKGTAHLVCSIHPPLDKSTGKGLPIRADDLLNLAFNIAPSKKCAKPNGSLVAIQSHNLQPFAIACDESRDAEIRFDGKSWGIRSFIVAHVSGFRTVTKRGESWFAQDNPNSACRQLKTKGQFEALFSSAVMVFAGCSKRLEPCLPPPVPAPALSDALVFGDPSEVILFRLVASCDLWKDAVTLATPFWDLKTGKLNRPIDFTADAAPDVEASIRFDPEREVQIGRLEAGKINATHHCVLALARYVECEIKYSSGVPALFKLMPMLKGLNISCCDEIKDTHSLLSLPSHTSLHTLSLTRCNMLADVSSLAALTQLVKLEVSRCNCLKTVTGVGALTSLEELDLHNCCGLTDISDLTPLSSLKVLAMNDCTALVDASPLAYLKALRRLDLNCCSALRVVPNMQSLTGLEELDLDSCKLITNLCDVVGPLRSLKLLKLDSCTQMRDTSAFDNLSELQSVHLNCEELSSVSTLQTATSLQTLHLTGCESLVDLSALASLVSLKELQLNRCTQVSDISAVAMMTSLETLSLSLSDQVTDFTSLASLHVLQDLTLVGCNLRNTSAIAPLSNLRNLSIYSCKQLVDLAGLGELQQLKSLDVVNCENLTDASALVDLKCLLELRLKSTRLLADVSFLPGLVSLEYLSLHECRVGNALPSLMNLPSLQELDLAYLQLLTNMSTLAPLPSLSILSVRKCEQLTDISGFAALKAVHTLDLNGCRNVRDLTPIASLASLEELNVNDCNSVKDMSFLTALTNLRTLFVDVYDLSDIAVFASMPSLEYITKGFATGII